MLLFVSQLLAAGKWVKLEKTTYVDPAGNTRYCSILQWHNIKMKQDPFVMFSLHTDFLR